MTKCELFFTLVDTLKAKGIHVAGVAAQMNLNPVTVRSWRSRGTGPTQGHIEQLVRLFPNQLKGKAEELGVLTPELLSKEERLEQLLAAARQRIGELEIEIEQIQGQATKEHEELQRKIDTLLKAIEKLTNS